MNGNSLEPTFVYLNVGWNADPNAPDPKVNVERTDVLLHFRLNYMIYLNFTEEDVGLLRFTKCERYRLGSTNDEGWYRGQCRYSRTAPGWGSFMKSQAMILKSSPPPIGLLFTKLRLEGDISYSIFVITPLNASPPIGSLNRRRRTHCFVSISQSELSSPFLTP